MAGQGRQSQEKKEGGTKEEKKQGKAENPVLKAKEGRATRARQASFDTEEKAGEEGRGAKTRRGGKGDLGERSSETGSPAGFFLLALTSASSRSSFAFASCRVCSLTTSMRWAELGEDKGREEQSEGQYVSSRRTEK